MKVAPNKYEYPFLAETQAERVNEIYIFHVLEYSNNIEYRNQNFENLVKPEIKIRVLLSRKWLPEARYGQYPQ
jgi:hypothetical protein